MSETKERVTETALKQQAEELRHSNAVLQTEIEMFESFLGRLDSLSLASQPAPQTEKEVGQAGKPESSETSQEPLNLLKLEQKYYIAVCELEEMRKEEDPKLQQKLSTSLATDAEYYKAAIEDSDMQLAEIKRERHDLEQFAAKTKQTTPILAQRAQKVIMYIEHKTKAKKAQTERMRRRNAFLRMENKKQQHMAHQMEQMRDMFSEIDLEHLKQKNIQYSETLQNFQEQLICHRVLIRKSQQGLKVYKGRLVREIQESESLSRKNASHEEKLSKIREQQRKVKKEQAAAEALNKKLKQLLANFRVPDVTKYVEAKAKNVRLRHTVTALERKARIAELHQKTKKCSPEDSSGCSRSHETSNPLMN